MLISEPIIGEGVPRIKPDGLSWLGIFAALTALLLVAGGLSLSSGLGTSSEGPEVLGIIVSAFLGYLEIGVVTQQMTLLGGILLILSLVYFAAAIGLFLARKWAWTLSIGLTILGIASNTVQIAVLGPLGVFDWMALLIAFTILFYLTRPRVRRFFNNDPRIVTANKP